MNQRDTPIERLRSSYRAILFPQRASGWRAAGLELGIALGVLLAARLIWLGVAASPTIWKLPAFAAMILSMCLWALAALVPERHARRLVGVALVALAASVIAVQLLPDG